MNPIDEVVGAERLTEIFGAWPSFHDAEILEVRFARLGQNEHEGPALEIVFHLFKGERDDSRASGVRWYDHTQATFRFSNVCELALEGFNSQNAILDLLIEKTGPHPLAPGLPAIRVTLQPAYGLGGSFVCSAIEIAELQKGCPPDSVYQS